MSRLALLHPASIGMGLHVASVRVRRAMRSHRRYAGPAEAVLRAGLEDCWSGRYLTASPGTYKQFWTRDTGFSAPSLVRLGGPWPRRLLSTLDWALEIWASINRTERIWRGTRARRGHVTTTISPVVRWPVDIFDYGVDSLPLLLHSLETLATSADAAVATFARGLALDHGSWIAAEVEQFVDEVVDPSTGLVRSDRAFSAHRDTFRNGSTAYANAMVALLARTVAETGWAPDLLSKWYVFPDSAGPSPSASGIPLAGIRPEGAVGGAGHIPATGIRNPESTPEPDLGNIPDLGKIDAGRAGRSADSGSADSGSAHSGSAAPRSPAFDWGLLLRRHFWVGDRFRDRLGTDETSGEANVWPFHLGLMDDPGDDMLRAALGTLRREGYTTPYPLKFETSDRTSGMLLAFRLWSPDYQTTTSWTSLGSIYLSLLRRVDPAAAHEELDRMRALIERDGTFWEVIDGSGRPWRSRSRLSISDASMLWGAILLECLEADRAWHTTPR